MTEVHFPFLLDVALCILQYASRNICCCAGSVLSFKYGLPSFQIGRAPSLPFLPPHPHDNPCAEHVSASMRVQHQGKGSSKPFQQATPDWSRLEDQSGHVGGRDLRLSLIWQRLKH